MFSGSAVMIGLTPGARNLCYFARKGLPCVSTHISRDFPSKVRNCCLYCCAVVSGQDEVLHKWFSTMYQSQRGYNTEPCEVSSQVLQDETDIAAQRQCTILLKRLGGRR